MAEIALDLKHALARRREDGTPGRTIPRQLARGDGWTVSDVLCTCGPDTRRFEERHSSYSISMVLAGTFQYASALGRGVMTPGAVMLGNRGQCFECSHEHGEGDRCLSFWYAPDYFEELAAGVSARAARFPVPRLPPLRALSPLVARAALGARGAGLQSWEELGAALASTALGLAHATGADRVNLPSNAEACVSRAVRLIDDDPHEGLTLRALSGHAGLSPWHFLRVFERLVGVTPHRYVRRTRLRKAALRLGGDAVPITQIAFDSGFGDVSNFNRAFRVEFGMSPRAFRQARR